MEIYTNVAKWWVLTLLLITLSISSAYLLGRISILVKNEQNLLILNNQKISRNTSGVNSQKNKTTHITDENIIYASKRGKKFYYIWCNTSIKEENKIFFNNESDAYSKGYTLSKTCQK